MYTLYHNHLRGSDIPFARNAESTSHVKSPPSSISSLSSIPSFPNPSYIKRNQHNCLNDGTTSRSVPHDTSSSYKKIDFFVPVTNEVYRPTPTELPTVLPTAIPTFPTNCSHNEFAPNGANMFDKDDLTIDYNNLFENEPECDNPIEIEELRDFDFDGELENFCKVFDSDENDEDDNAIDEILNFDNMDFDEIDTSPQPHELIFPGDDPIVETFLDYYTINSLNGPSIEFPAKKQKTDSNRNTEQSTQINMSSYLQDGESLKRKVATHLHGDQSALFINHCVDKISPETIINGSCEYLYPNSMNIQKYGIEKNQLYEQHTCYNKIELMKKDNSARVLAASKRERVKGKFKKRERVFVYA